MVKGDYATSLLEMRGITKAFSGVRALKGVDLDVRPGEVHCILGQNGAGKSTLIKILAGAYQPDGGEIIWQGEPVTLTHPLAALELGIATMYQELDVVDGLSITENIFLGHELATAGVLHRGAANKKARELLTRLGHGDLNPNREVGTLSAANKQIVSMARALSHDIKLIIMDEPSAVLDSEEVKNLFRVVRTSPRRASRSSTSPTDSKRSARSATGSRCSRTDRAWHPASRSPTPRRPTSSGS